MRKSSCLFRKLNCLTSCGCFMNRHVLRICRSLNEANNALCSRKEQCGKKDCRRGRRR